MSVRLEIGGRSFGIAPFMLGELRKAAPHIDRMNEIDARIAAAQPRDDAEAAAGQGPKFEDLAALMHEFCEILAIGIAKVDPEIDVEWVEAQVDLSFMGSLQKATFEILSQSGLAKSGEAKAP